MAHATFGALAGVDIDAEQSDQWFTLGDRVCGSDGGFYEYIKADATVAVNSAVQIDDDGTIASLTTAISAAEETAVGVAMNAFSATNYGWVVRQGEVSVLVAASCAADVTIGTTTTAGVLDDSFTDAVSGLRLSAANGGSQAAAAGFATVPMATNLDTTAA